MNGQQKSMYVVSHQTWSQGKFKVGELRKQIETAGHGFTTLPQNPTMTNAIVET